MQLNKQEKRKMIQLAAALSGEWTALLCAFFYRNICQGTVPAVLLVFGFFSVVTAVSVNDLKCQKISDWLCGLILGITITAVFLMPEIASVERMKGMVVIGSLMLAATWILPGVFGGGDIKLMAVCGGFLGWDMIRNAFVAAVIAAAGVSLLLLAKEGGRRRGIAMAPFFELGMAVSFLENLIEKI